MTTPAQWRQIEQRTADYLTWITPFVRNGTGHQPLQAKVRLPRKRTPQQSELERILSTL